MGIIRSILLERRDKERYDKLEAISSDIISSIKNEYIKYIDQFVNNPNGDKQHYLDILEDPSFLYVTNEDCPNLRVYIYDDWMMKAYGYFQGDVSYGGKVFHVIGVHEKIIKFHKKYVELIETGDVNNVDELKNEIKTVDLINLNFVLIHELTHYFDFLHHGNLGYVKDEDYASNDEYNARTVNLYHELRRNNITKRTFSEFIKGYKVLNVYRKKYPELYQRIIKRVYQDLPN